MNLFQLFHLTTKHTDERVKTSTWNANTHPEWAIIDCKDYERLPRVSLPEPGEPSTRLVDAIAKRCSSWKFTSSFTLQTLSDILHWSLGLKEGEASGTGKEKRMYPSAGGMYPLETYLLVFEDMEGLPAGVYHYRPFDHQLSLLKKNPFTEDFLSYMTVFGDSIKPKVGVVFTAVFHRTMRKYNERGYRFILLEAGCAAHNITLNATAHGIASVHMGGANDTRMEAMLDIDGDNEAFIHSVFLG